MNEADGAHPPSFAAGSFPSAAQTMTDGAIATFERDTIEGMIEKLTHPGFEDGMTA